MIIVTARRVDENLQDVPLTVNVVTGRNSTNSTCIMVLIWLPWFRGSTLRQQHPAMRRRLDCAEPQEVRLVGG